MIFVPYLITKIQQMATGYEVSFFVLADGGYTVTTSYVSNESGSLLKAGDILPETERGGVADASADNMEMEPSIS